MTATYDEATDTINSLLYNLWVTNSAAIAGYVPAIYWPTIELPKEPPVDKCWARISRQTVIQSQANIAGADSVRRYTTRGLVSVQIFAPRIIVNSGGVCIALGKLVQSAYRGITTSNGLWFRNVTLKELAADTRYNRCNVVSDFQYDEVG